MGITGGWYDNHTGTKRENDTLFLPDFDTSNDILKVLKKLKVQKPRLYKKLLSDDIRYTQLRNELFPTGENLKKVSLFNSSEFGVSQWHPFFICAKIPKEVI